MIMINVTSAPRGFLKHTVLLSCGIIAISQLTGCTLNNTANLLYNSAVSYQKFNCEENKIGNSITTCKAHIDQQVKAGQAQHKQQQTEQALKNESSPGYQPKDFVTRQLNRTKSSKP